MQSEFYCVFYNGPYQRQDPIAGWSIVSSEVPNKPGKFAETKSVNYLQNALMLMDAQDQGADQGVFMHADGTICEGSNLNVGLITKEGLIRTPPFEQCLAGCSMSRLLELVPLAVQRGEGDLEGITGIEQVRTGLGLRSSTRTCSCHHLHAHRTLRRRLRKVLGCSVDVDCMRKVEHI